MREEMIAASVDVQRPGAVRLYSLIGAMTFLWTLNFIIAKYALREMPALLAGGLRIVLAGAIILPVYLWSTRAEPRSWSLRNIPELLLLGACGVTMNQMFFVVGIGATSVGHAAFIIGLTPILVLLLAAAIGQEQLRGVKLVGLGLALTGVMLIQLAGARGGEATLFGDFFVFLAGLTFAIFTVYTKRAGRRYSGLLINTVAYVAGGLMLLPVTWMLSRGIEWSRISILAWSSVVYMAVFPSVVCYSIYAYALKYVPASRLSSFSYVQPVLATLLAIPLLGERPTASLLAGGALVLTGVVLAERS
jgi:drug/metabolite transporter (DMT)-like permease